MMMNSFSFTFCCFSSTAYLPLGEVVKTRAHQLGCFSAGGWAIAKNSLLNVLLSRWNCSQPGQSFLESAKTIEEWLWKSPLKFSTNGQLVQIFDFLWCFRTFAMFPQRIEDSFQLSSPSSPQVMEAEMSKIFQKSKKILIQAKNWFFPSWPSWQLLLFWAERHHDKAPKAPRAFTWSRMPLMSTVRSTTPILAWHVLGLDPQGGTSWVGR